MLVVASGATLRPEETDGVSEAIQAGVIHSFYSLEGAAALAEALATFGSGRLVVNVVDMPIKCPVVRSLSSGDPRRRGDRSAPCPRRNSNVGSPITSTPTRRTGGHDRPA